MTHHIPQQSMNLKRQDDNERHGWIQFDSANASFRKTTLTSIPFHFLTLTIKNNSSTAINPFEAIEQQHQQQ